MSDIKVMARVTCPRYNCVGGKLYAPVIHEGPGPVPPYEQDCDRCGGKGYIEDWHDLGALVDQVVVIA